MTKDIRYIKDYGGQGAPIILLHGFLASSRYWKRLQPHLARAGFRVITIDLLGFGAAPKPKKHTSYTYDEHIAHIHRCIATLSLDNFTLAGHSMGGVLAARYAITHPEKIQQNILLNPPLYMSPDEARQTLRNTGKIYRFLLDSRFRQAGWVLLKTLAKPLVGHHNQYARHGSLHHVIERAELFSDLEKITVKTLILVGAEDRPQYLQNIYRNELGSHITIVKLPMSHHAPLFAPLAVTKAVTDLLNA